MSAKLGKIHYWLFDQIKIIDDRNQFLLKNNSKLKNKYDYTLKNVSLEEALDGNHIHPGLESLIVKVQNLESKIVIDLLKEESVEKLKNKYFEHGKMIAKQKAQKSSNLIEAANSLKDIFLERMPCDRLSKIKNLDNEVQIIRQDKLHTEFWKSSKDKMHLLYSKWIKGALSIINSDIEHKRKLYEEEYIDYLKFKED